MEETCLTKYNIGDILYQEKDGHYLIEDISPPDAGSLMPDYHWRHLETGIIGKFISYYIDNDESFSLVA